MGVQSGRLDSRSAAHTSCDVIQGSFRFGLWHLGGSQHQLPQSSFVPRTSAIQPLAAQLRTANSHTTQPASRMNAVPLPPSMSGVLAGAGSAGTGQRLPQSLQRQMEAVFRADFSDVRVHAGPQAASLGALAFAHGPNIHFAPGHYNPATPAGRQLLAHELTHVVQQRGGRVRNPFGRGIAIVNDPAMEAEANQMATRAASSTAPVLQAKPRDDAAARETLPRGGFPTQDIGRRFRKTGGKEKDFYPLEQGKVAAVSKTGDLRRIQSEVRTLHSLSDHGVPTIRASEVIMFRRGDWTSPGFIVDWIPNSIDSNADPAGFRSALGRLRPELRRVARGDLNKVEGFVNRFGGILDLQLLLDGTGRLRVLDPRGETDDPTSSLQLIQNWRATLDG